MVDSEGKFDSKRERLARQRRKRMLAVRAMAGETEWLAWTPRWRDGRAVWESEGRVMAPEVTDVALAQRRLRQIGNFTIAGKITLGDVESWVEQRSARLELVKYLLGLRSPDMAGLARAARAGDGAAIRQVAALLAAEALCAGEIEPFPSATLLGAGDAAAPTLAEVAGDNAVPVAGQVLAALVLGAIHKRGDVYQPPKADAVALRGYRWSLRYGLPATPGLLAGLLAAPEGEALAKRMQRLAEADSPLALPGGMLRELLARQEAPTNVVELAEAALAATPIVAQMRDYRDLLPEKPEQERRFKATELARQRETMIARLGEIVREYALANPDPAVLRALAAFGISMLSIAPQVKELFDALLAAMSGPRSLPAKMQGRFLQMLVENRAAFWVNKRDPFSLNEGELGGWLRRQSLIITSVAELAERIGSVEIARDTLLCGDWDRIVSIGGNDPDVHAWALALLRNLELRFLPWPIMQMLRGHPERRRTLGPLLNAVRAVAATSADLREHLLDRTLTIIPGAPDLEDTIAWRARMVRYLRQFDHSRDDGVCPCWAFMEGAYAIEAAGVADAESWLEWLRDFLIEIYHDHEGKDDDDWSPGLWSMVAAQLAGSDLAEYKRIMSAGVARPIHKAVSDEGLRKLVELPTMRAVLAHFFPLQPDNCIDFLREFELTEKLQENGTLVLARLTPGDDTAIPATWEPLLRRAPELTAEARAYSQAQQIQGVSDEPPAGVRQALEQFAGIQRELAYIEAKIADGAAPAMLARRAASLRERLADEERMLGLEREEAAERLHEAMLTAQFRAAEYLVRSLYRQRLATVAGPLPEGLELGPDLLNATLLTADIRYNRRLLLRLLRGYLGGDRRWPETHPTNKAYLKKLAAGVDVEAWLGDHPHTYRSAKLPGRWIRLHLERDPLAVLQMGNYFDTCLSFGGINSFSTVANACELNKRVIYATDSRGRVAGRKLIAISDEGKLVGFRTYTSLTDHEQNAILREIFRRYCIGFAERCGLELAQDGTVPTLFAEGWYDDGIVDWDEEKGGSGASFS